MNSEFSHVFDLTSSEKLQLVEDLWDSIASDAEQLPCLIGKKKNLPGERLLIFRILTQVVQGKLLKNEFAAVSMVLRNLIILPEIEGLEFALS